MSFLKNFIPFNSDPMTIGNEPWRNWHIHLKRCQDCAKGEGKRCAEGVKLLEKAKAQDAHR